MPLNCKKVSNELSDDGILWRYMGLDKLIDLLDRKSLYFSSLNSYSKSDPFEGLLPKNALNKIAEILLVNEKSFNETFNKIKTLELLYGNSNERESKINELQEMSKEVKYEIEKKIFKILSAPLVNCWHMNNSESEAMWRLYSDNNKGIAIKTSVRMLSESIDDSRVSLSKVKYIDFEDPTLELSSIAINANIGPVIKRTSFEHENEVRLHFLPNGDESPYIDVNLNTMIDKIYISPYAGEPYISSVKALARKFGVGENKVIISNLLSPNEELRRIF